MYRPPENCVKWNDGCNTCSVNDNGDLENCTEMACFVQGESSCLEYKTGGVKPPRVEKINPPKYCTGWFDGCNMCSAKDGKTILCTMKWCEAPEKPRCTAYTPPAGCKTWFDGCNNCRVMEGDRLACTKMFCSDDRKTEPTCREFEQE